MYGLLCRRAVAIVGGATLSFYPVHNSPALKENHTVAYTSTKHVGNGNPDRGVPWYRLGGWARANLVASADAEHLGPARGACSRGGGLAVLHGDGLWVPDLSLAPTFDTIGFHHNPPSVGSIYCIAVEPICQDVV